MLRSLSTGSHSVTVLSRRTPERVFSGVSTIVSTDGITDADALTELVEGGTQHLIPTRLAKSP